MSKCMFHYNTLQSNTNLIHRKHNYKITMHIKAFIKKDKNLKLQIYFEYTSINEFEKLVMSRCHWLVNLFPFNDFFL